jgi:hypothetical protein
MPAGERKIPEPIVMPTTMATALHNPRLLGRPPLSLGEADMRQWYSQDARGASQSLVIPSEARNDNRDDS